ncbi:MAG: ABC transporter permease [Chloroflexi bacterium]|jgi:simple sugar transport system permease protein|nr:ABC transporter permease [Chloroflexota bacterium]
MDAASIGGFLFVVVVSGAVLLPATLGSIVTELSGATNLGVEGLMLFGAMVAYGTAFTTGDAMLGAAAGTLAGGILSLTHAIPVVYGRMTQERQLVLGLILVYLGDALSRLLGAPYISKASKALDVRWTVPYLADLPVVGEALFRQYGLVYVTYGLALALWFVLYRTRAGLHLRAVGEDAAAADAAGIHVDRYRLGAIVIGGCLVGFAGAVLSLTVVRTWTEGMTRGRGWIALGLVTFANWHPLWAIAGTLLFGGFEAAQFRLVSDVPGVQYLLGILPYVAPIVALPVMGRRLARRRAGAPAGLGRPYFREART